MNKLTPRRFPFLEDYRLPHGYELIKRKRKLADENEFRIYALGDKVSLSEDGGIFTSILGFGLETLSNLFGGNSKKLTQSDWMQIMPVSGYWNNALRIYLSQHIKWDTDLGNIPQYTIYFVHTNLSELSGGTWANLDTSPPAGVLGQYVNLFYDKLSKERQDSGYKGGVIDLSKQEKNNEAGFGSWFNNADNEETIITIVKYGLLIGLGFAFVKKLSGKK